MANKLTYDRRKRNLKHLLQNSVFKKIEKPHY